MKRPLKSSIRILKANLSWMWEKSTWVITKTRGVHLSYGPLCSVIPLQRRTILFAGFFLAGPPQRVDCLAPRWR